MVELKVSHKIAAGVAVVLVLGVAAYLIISGLPSSPSSSPPAPKMAITSSSPPSPVETSISPSVEVSSKQADVASEQLEKTQAKVSPSTGDETKAESGIWGEPAPTPSGERVTPETQTTTSTVAPPPPSPTPDEPLAPSPPPNPDSPHPSNNNATDLSFSPVEIIPQEAASTQAPQQDPFGNMHISEAVAGPPGQQQQQQQQPPPEQPPAPQPSLPDQAQPNTVLDPDSEPLLDVPDRSEAELNAWREFRKVYPKPYPTKGELQKRQAIFIGNLRFITNFNAANEALFKLGTNHFADMTRDEINNLYIGTPTNWSSVMGAKEDEDGPPALTILAEGPNESLGKVDWQNVTIMPVDQSICKESSVFAVVASIEAKLNAQLMPQQLPPVKLSEQQVLDCLARFVPTAPPCAGRMPMAIVFDMLSKTQIGLLSLQDYMDIRRQTPPGQPPIACQPPAAMPTRTRLSSFTTVHRQNIPEAIRHSGPLVVAIDASQSTFHFYRSGLYHDTNCSPAMYNSHALLVGYEPGNGRDSNGQPTSSYTLRLSFGPNWGEGGHIRLLKDESRNKCLPQRVGMLPELAQ